MATTTTTVPASRTRSVLFVVLAVFSGVIAHEAFGGNVFYALWGFAGGALLALILGGMIGWTVERATKRKTLRETASRRRRQDYDW